MAHESVPIKPAATVMLLRDGDDGVEVFMLRRTTAAVFASGMYVFPGGKVDAADGEGDEAFVAAAIRECFEEAGVLLAVDDQGHLVQDGHPALTTRDEVYRGEISMSQLCARHGLRLLTDGLPWVSHWITPKGEAPRRFDTRFFLARSPQGQTSHHDDNETVASMWIRPAEALDRGRAGELMLMPPTVANLEFLSEHATADEAMAYAATLPPPPCILPKALVRDGRFVGVVMPGEPGYDDLD
jgi:8-oxo-dGTP pyrophosphatase MutT (NUDIX family)